MKVIKLNTLIMAILILAIVFGSVSAQERELDIFGYFEPQLSAMSVNGEMLQLTSNKLRLDLKVELSEKITFAANFDYITYNGATTYNLVEFLPDHITAGLPLEVQESLKMEFNDRNFLDNAFLKIAFEKFDLTAGKQQISPGTGYAWNPTDLFNFKNILDPTYEQPGQNAIRTDIPFGLNANLSLLYSPEENFKQSGKFIRFKLNAGRFDLSATAGERYWPHSDYLTVMMTSGRRRMAGIDIAGEIKGIGIWTETAFNTMSISDDFLESVTGIDYTFESGFYLLGEYLYSERGKTDYRDYNINDWMSGFTSERLAMTRNQVFLYCSHPATDLLTIGGSVIASLDDNSAVLVPSIQYNYDDNLDLTIFGNIYAGSGGKTYNSDLGTGGLIRARYYF